MPQELSEQQMAALSKEIRAGRKIRAIGVYREATGVGLRAAKKGVEEVELMLHEQNPEQFPAKRGGKGCSVFTGIGCLAIGSALYFSLNP